MINTTAITNLVECETFLRHGNYFECPYHSHPALEIVYHPNGKGKTILNDKSTYHFTTDTVIIYYPNVVHNQVMEKGGEDVCLRMIVDNCSWLPKDKQCLKVELKHNYQLKNDIISLEKSFPLKNKSNMQSFNLHATALLIDLLNLAETQLNNSETVNKASNSLKAYEYIINKSSNISSVQEVADKIGISYDYLRHQFRETYGFSMKQHLINTRIEQATRFLIYTPLSLKQIATECGFDNIRYFCTCFKRQTGISPGAYRKQHMC